MTTSLTEEIQNCMKCPLYTNMPHGCKPVPGIGPIPSPMMIVGEALGEDESIVGKPFQGQCGRLLNNMLRDADIDREKVFISNVVKCRPTKTKGKSISNRPPTKDEITTCGYWLKREIEKVRPRIIFTLGMVPTRYFLHLKSTAKLSDYIGKSIRIIDAEIDYFVVPIYHPSYVMVHSRSDYNLCVDIFKQYKV